MCNWTKPRLAYNYYFAVYQYNINVVVHQKPIAQVSSCAIIIRTPHTITRDDAGHLFGASLIEQMRCIDTQLCY